MREEHCHDQQNSGEISSGVLHRGGTRNPIRVDIFTTRHLEHVGCICRSGEYDQGNLFALFFFGNTKTLSSIVRALSTMSVKKSGLELLHPASSAKEKYLISQRASAELIWAMMGGGAFSNANHLLALREERRDRKKTGMT